MPGPARSIAGSTTKAGKDDPLLFVESIPVAETRYYVKHLMEYHWMYRRRLGQDAKSLDETARGAMADLSPRHAGRAGLAGADQRRRRQRFSDVSYSQPGDNTAGNAQSVQ